MDRMTTKQPDGRWALKRRPGITNRGQMYETLKAIDRLGAYEDTGLEPEQIKDMTENAETSLLTWFEAEYGFSVGELMRMLEAKQKGRLVVLPWAIGTHIFNVDKQCGEVTEYAVSHYCVYSGEVFITAVLPMYPSACRVFSVERSGKDIFLTREEAEKALEGGTQDV